MTQEEWEQLEALCRKALDEASPQMRHHPTFEAVALAGAFAASIARRMEAGA